MLPPVSFCFFFHTEEEVKAIVNQRDLKEYGSKIRSVLTEENCKIVAKELGTDKVDIDAKNELEKTATQKKIAKSLKMRIFKATLGNTHEQKGPGGDAPGGSGAASSDTPAVPPAPPKEVIHSRIYETAEAKEFIPKTKGCAIWQGKGRWSVSYLQRAEGSKHYSLPIGEDADTNYHAMVGVIAWCWRCHQIPFPKEPCPWDFGKPA